MAENKAAIEEQGEAAIEEAAASTSGEADAVDEAGARLAFQRVYRSQFAGAVVGLLLRSPSLLYSRFGLCGSFTTSS